MSCAINSQTKFRKSEEDEVARLIGPSLIHKCEELRDELARYMEIYNDMMSEKEQKLQTKTNKQESSKKTFDIFSQSGNKKFLD